MQVDVNVDGIWLESETLAYSSILFLLFRCTFLTSGCTHLSPAALCCLSSSSYR